MKPPIDRGWSWLIVAGAFINSFFVVGGFKTVGIIYVHVMEKFDASDSLAAWMIGLISFGLSLYSPLATAIGVRYTYRVPVITGAVVMSLGFFIAAFATNIYYVVCVLGILVGFGNGFMYTPSMIMVGQNFDRLRSLAMGIAAGGASFGQLTIPLLIRHLLDNYGFQGCMLIYSALLMNCVVAGALFRPLSFYSPKGSKTKLPQTDVEVEEDAHPEQASGRTTPKPLPLETPSQSLNSLVFQSHIQDSLTSTPMVHLTREQVAETETTLDTLSPTGPKGGTRQSAHYSSTGSLCMVPESPDKKSTKYKQISGNPDSTEDLADLEPKKSNWCKVCMAPFLSIFDREVFATKAFWCAFTGTVIANSGYIDQFLFMPPYAKQIGVEAANRALILSVSGVADLIGRISGGFLNNFKFIKTNYFVSLSLLSSVVVVGICLSFPSYETLMAHGIAVGLLGGMYIALFPVVLLEVVGMAKFPSAFAFTMIGVGCINLPLPAVFGKISESTRSYFIPFSILNAMMLAGALLFMIVQLVHRLDKTSSPSPGSAKIADSNDQGTPSDEAKV